MRKILFLILLLIPVIGNSQNIPFAFWKSSGGALDTVRMFSPAYAETEVITTPALQWYPLDNASKFIVELSSISNFSSIIRRDTTDDEIPILDYIAVGYTLSVGTQYYWRVRGIASGFTESPNVVTPFKFTTESPYLTTTDSLLARMSGSLSTARRGLIDTTIRMMKDSTVWDSLDVVWFMANKDTVSSSQNWKSSSYTLIRPRFGSTPFEPIFVADSGYKNTGSGNIATGGYRTGGWNPATNGVNFQKLTASYGFWSMTNDTGANTVALGGKQDTAGVFRYIYFTPFSSPYTNVVAGINDVTTPTFTNSIASSLGLFTINRADTSTIQWYHNGTLKASQTAYATKRPNFPMFILALNYNGSPLYYAPHRVAIVYFGAKLSATGMRKLYNCFNYYMTGLSTHP